MDFYRWDFKSLELREISFCWFGFSAPFSWVICIWSSWLHCFIWCFILIFTRFYRDKHINFQAFLCDQGSYTLVCCGTLLCIPWHSCYCVNKLVLLHSKPDLQLSHSSLFLGTWTIMYSWGKSMWQDQPKILLQEQLSGLQQQVVCRHGR